MRAELGISPVALAHCSTAIRTGWAGRHSGDSRSNASPAPVGQRYRDMYRQAELRHVAKKQIFHRQFDSCPYLPWFDTPGAKIVDAVDHQDGTQRTWIELVCHFLKNLPGHTESGGGLRCVGGLGKRNFRHVVGCAGSCCVGDAVMVAISPEVERKRQHEQEQGQYQNELDCRQPLRTSFVLLMFCHVFPLKVDQHQA